MQRRQTSRRSSYVKDLLVPHQGNKHHPLLFSSAAAVGVVLIVLILQGVYLLDTHVFQKGSTFTASVLPSVLETLTNNDRENSGVADVTIDPLLTKSAQLKANDMAEYGYFAHTSPAGKTPWYWLDQVGYNYTYAGENLAVDFSDSKDVENAWMASATHHANIVKPEYTRIGFGVADGMYQGHRTTFVVEEFATPRVEGASGSGQSAALGAESGSSQQRYVPDFFQILAASPTHTITYVLGLLAAFLAVMVGITLGTHARIQYVEVAGTGLVMVSILLIAIMVNQIVGGRVTVPSSAQPAAVIQASP